MYFFRTIQAEIFTENVQQSDDSIDNFLADTLCFPENYKMVNSQCYTKAWNQIKLGIRDSGFGCHRNFPMIVAAQISALADAIRWCQKYSIMMPCLSAPAVYLLQDTIRPFLKISNDFSSFSLQFSTFSPHLVAVFPTLRSLLTFFPFLCLGFGVWGLGFGVWGLGFRVWGLGFRV